MVSKVEIWNRALDLLGERITILDETETNANANLCRRTYERVYKAVQRAYPWKCLKAQASLAADASAPAFGYSFQYSVPNDFGRLLQVYREEKFVNRNPWQFLGGKIQTDIEAPLNILYLRYSDNPSEWDELLQDAITYRMAADMAESLTQDPTKKVTQYAAYDAAVSEAQHTDAFEQQPKNMNDGNWVDSRFAGGAPIGDTYGDSF